VEEIKYPPAPLSMSWMPHQLNHTQPKYIQLMRGRENYLKSTRCG